MTQTLADVFRAADRNASVCLLGVRYFDPLSNGLVSEGLRVAAHPVDRPDQTRRAVLNNAHTFCFFGLPGLREAESGTGDAPFWQHWGKPANRRAFTVRVEDDLGRYLPFSFPARVPFKGLFTLDLELLTPPPGEPAPPPAPLAVPLFSAPGRPAPEAMAGLRFEVREANRAAAPAAWAVVRLDVEPNPNGLAPAPPPPAYGVADARGQVMLPFPYPQPPPRSTTPGPPVPPPAPGSLGPRALSQQQWAVRLSAFYRRRNAASDAPNLVEVFRRRPVEMWSEFSRTHPVTTVTARFGRENVFLGDQKQSTLYLTPAP